MTSLFGQSPDELDELQHLFLNYVNRDFPNCICGCRGFPINILTVEFNEDEIDLEVYKSCPARHERSALASYTEFKKDPIYKNFLTQIYPERYGGRRPTRLINKVENRQQKEQNRQARELARSKGETTFQGSECINGHSGIRKVSNNSCIECARFSSSLRDAIQRGAFRERLSEKDKIEISGIYQQSRETSKKTGIEHHVDHIKPLSAGGRHHPKNLQILTAEDNLRKGAKYQGTDHKYSKQEKQKYEQFKNLEKIDNAAPKENLAVKKSADKNKHKSFFQRIFGS